MADIGFGSVERIFKAGMAIRKAVKTVQQNKKKCRDIDRSVARVGALLSLLNETTETFKHPAISGPLEDLAESMEEALELIKDCEGKNSVRRLFGAGGMARELGRVHDDILRKLTLGNFATTVHITITLTRTVQYSDAHHPHMQLQDAGEVMNSYNGHLTADDARSGINSEITMETTATEVSYDPSSRLTELNLSELEATTTMHHVSEETISAGGVHSVVLKQKIVFRVSMPSERSRIRALTLVAKVHGVSSLWIKGDGRDTLQVVGEGLDAIRLMRCLRRKMGHADLLKVEQVSAKAKEAQPVPVVLKGEEEARPAARINGGIRDIVTSLSRFMWPRARKSISSRPPQAPLRLEHTDELVPKTRPDVCVPLDAGATHDA